MRTIFYSWQSDLPSEINEKFIELSIEEAITNVNEADIEIEVSPREKDRKLGLDRDTKNTPGSPPIVDTIFKKIDSSSIFVADLTFVAQTETNPRTNKRKLVPNPNVMIEYGYAWKSKGEKRILAIMNTAFGSPSEQNLPFNIRHLEFPIQYELRTDSTDAQKEHAKQLIANQLVPKIKLILDKESGNPGVLNTKLLPSKFYILRKKIILVLRFRIINSDVIPTTVNSEYVRLIISNKQFDATRTTIPENTIQTAQRGSVLFHYQQDEPLLRKEQDVRIDSHGSRIFNMAYETNSRELLEEIQGKETLYAQGEIKSYDGKVSKFEGEVQTYR